MSVVPSSGVDVHSFIKMLEGLRPTSRPDMISKIKSVLSDSLTEIIDTHNTASIIFVFTTHSTSYLMKAEYDAPNATEKEIIWYKTVPDSSLTPTYITSFSTTTYSFLILEYIDKAATIDELIKAKRISSEDATRYILAALEEDERLFNRGRAAQYSREDCDKFLIGKYRKRRVEAQGFPYLDSFFSSSVVRINGQSFRSPESYIAQIAADVNLYNYLTPDTLGFIHGDLHCGNILIKDNELFFIDPNGTLGMPLEYDYGKMLHTVHGYYNSIMRKDYTLTTQSNEYILEVNTSAEYDDAHEAIKRKLSDQTYHRAMYAEAMHFATLLPHHAREQTETTVLFLRCVQIFGELFGNLNTKQPPPRRPALQQ